MSLPNIITVIRLICIPLAVILNFVSIPNNFLLAGLVFLLIAATDNLDGYIARKYNQVTQLGIFLDPLVDKMLNYSMLITLLSLNVFPLWIILFLFVRDMAIEGFTSYAVSQNKFIPATWPGKIKAVFIVLGIFVGEIYLHSIRYSFFGFSSSDIRNFAYLLLVFAIIIGFTGMIQAIQHFSKNLKVK